jgi:YHS domain-containing protein
MVRTIVIVCAAVASAVLVAGCAQQNATDKQQPATPAAAQPAGEKDHAHKPGNHGGIVVEIGRDNYHAEVVFDKAGVVRLFTLGQDETRVLEVERQELKAYAKAEGSAEAEEFVLRPEPQSGDSPSKTSVFTGQLPAALAGKNVEVTVPNIRIGGERFRFSFASAAAHEGDLPATTASDDEKKMYLTPAGKYTADDIKANGNMTAPEKYKSFKASHDLKPKPGDAICPVTLTKANPECTWVIGGETYQFCCPPCIDEFVAMAREQPELIRPPQSYKKK